MHRTPAIRPASLPTVWKSLAPTIARLVGCLRRLLRSNYNDSAIAAKLRCAVEHAGLAAHQQVPDLVGRERRKDFLNRVRDQANLRRSGKTPTTCSSPASAPSVSGHTILANRDRDKRPYRK